MASKEPLIAYEPPEDYDGMARYPSPSPAGLLRALDYIGTVAFAASGCMTAGLAGMHLLGCIIVGTITSIGGGTVRDVLIAGMAARMPVDDPSDDVKGNTPVFWVEEYEYVLMCLVVTVATFVYMFESRHATEPPALWWADTVGLAAFSVIGCQHGVRRSLHWTICLACGLFTATFGGVDLLCQRPVRIMHAHAEIYASTSILAALAYVLAKRAGLRLVYRIAIGLSVAVSSRIYAAKHDIRLPSLPPGIR